MLGQLLLIIKDLLQSLQKPPIQCVTLRLLILLLRVYLGILSLLFLCLLRRLLRFLLKQVNDLKMRFFLLCLLLCLL